MTVCSLAVKGVKNCRKNFVNLSVGLQIAEGIVRKGGSRFSLRNLSLLVSDFYK